MLLRLLIIFYLCMISFSHAIFKIKWKFIDSDDDDDDNDMCCWIMSIFWPISWIIYGIKFLLSWIFCGIKLFSDYIEKLLKGE